jgi:hypothetical protein
MSSKITKRDCQKQESQNEKPKHKANRSAARFSGWNARAIAARYCLISVTVAMRCTVPFPFGVFNQNPIFGADFQASVKKVPELGPASVKWPASDLVRRAWNQFYRSNPKPTREQVLQQARQIDSQFGSKFRPPVKD